MKVEGDNELYYGLEEQKMNSEKEIYENKGESSSSSSSSFKILCGKVKKPDYFYAGMLVTISFTLFCFIPVIIGSLKLNKLKGRRNEDLFVSPSDAVFAMHFVFNIIMIVVGVLLIFYSMKCFSKWWVIGASILGLIFYIAYVAVFFTSLEFKAGSEVIDFNEFNHFQEQLSTTLPYIEVSNYGDIHNSSGNSVGHCSGPSYKYYASTAIDKTKWANTTDIREFLFQMEFSKHINWDSNSMTFIDKAKEILKQGPSTTYQCTRYHRIQWSANSKNVIPGYKSILMVSKNGDLPKQMSKTKGIVSGIFFMGITYCYNVDAYAPRIKIDINMDASLRSGQVLPSYSEVQNHYSCNVDSKC